jgi:hypothetical protein
MKKIILFALVALCAIAVIPASAVIVTNTVPAVTADAFPISGLGKVYMLEGTCDLAAQYAAGSTNAAADKVAVIKVPTGAYVMRVSATVLTAPVAATAAWTNNLSAATTFNVGDDDSANNWIVTASNTNAITTVSTPVLTLGGTNTSAAVVCTPTAALGKLYTSSENLNIQWTAAPGNYGVIKVKALVINAK